MKKLILTFAFAFALLISSIPLSVNAQSTYWLDGQWEGTGYQKDNGHNWTILLTADIDRGIYKIEYPSLSCGGEWVLSEIDGQRAVFTEKITDGIFRCANLGKVIVTPVDQNHISFTWFWHSTQELGAWSTLERIAPL